MKQVKEPNYFMMHYSAQSHNNLHKAELFPNQKDTTDEGQHLYTEISALLSRVEG